MKRISFLISLFFAVLYVNAQVIRPFTARYSNTSVRGGIVYVSNNIIESVGAVTSEVPPGGTSTNNGHTGANTDIDNTTTTLLAYNSSWKYWDANSRPANWETVAFNDAAWPSGNGQLGWGQATPAPLSTCINSGCASSCPTPPGSCSNRTPAYYFRHVVSLTPSSYTTIRLNLKRNDGVVIYINDTERARDNMPGGAILHTTFSTAAIAGGSAAENYTVDLSPSFFVSGNNTIAVEIHTDKAKAADVTFDMQVQGINDNGTFNSSSADLSLSSCSEVMWAGLYWGAGQGTNGTNTAWITGETSVKFKAPGAGSYTILTSTQTDYHNSTLSPGLPHTGFKCFKDITSLINTASPNGTYTIADVVSPAGIVNTYGGWCIVIAYSNPSLAPRNLTIFDGNVIINSGDPPADVTVSGFLTPASGTVSCELGSFVYDGDRTSLDSFLFRQNGAPSFYNLTPNTLANLNDQWNSTISHKGVVVTTRNPAYQNTNGIDADIIDLPNAGNAQLSNSQTSATIRFASPSENYFVQVVTTSISQFDPSIELSKLATDVNAGSLVGGDVLEYRLDYTNVGNDAGTNTIVIDNIPLGTTFKPGSLTINGTAKTDGSGDDQAEYDLTNNRVVFRVGTGANSSSGGTVAVSGTGYVTFQVYVPASCSISSCYPTLRNRAGITYSGQTSLLSFADSSGYTVAGCFTSGPVTNTVTGSCLNLTDSTLINICPSTSITIPLTVYGGFVFYSAMPFTSGNLFDPATAITSSRIIYAYWDGPGSCDDTLQINVFHQNCPDLDEDNDGIPDYVELNMAIALSDSDSDGIPNWYDLDYPGRVDNNTDGINDNFDPGADSDNDGLVNFMDPNWAGFIDADGDDINDNFDTDMDGVPDFLDRDSDNDAIPDVVESYGVDANGDGVIDNYSDSDADGLSQNVDACSGISCSGNGLGYPDKDGDGVPNYKDLDSDNDGIPDVIEVSGTDANNDGHFDGTADNDLDGYFDTIDGDADNNGIAENSSAALLKTGADNNSDGRADSYPYKNPDADAVPNPYDMDSDMDGILDVIEAGFSDANFDGIIDGAINSNGWSAVVDSLGSLSLPNTDASGSVNAYDIDSDNDGIPDNVEGLPTIGYLLPSNSDTDGDGLDNIYDNVSGFGGNGINPVDTDGDTIPDYLDSDTDGDGQNDIIEGNDYNLDGLANDLVALTGVDTDGDGLDDRFDVNNSSAEGTSAYMGNGGSFTGDPSPGSNTMVQKTPVGATDRDWRNILFLLDCDFTSFKAVVQNHNKTVLLDWTVYCRQVIDHFEIERSFDGVSFTIIQTVAAQPILREITAYQTTDDISQLKVKVIYYRLKARGETGRFKYSSVVSVKTNSSLINEIQIAPNPVKEKLQLSIKTESSLQADISITNMNGRVMLHSSQTLLPGVNNITYDQVNNWQKGVYLLMVNTGDTMLTRKFIVFK